MPVKKTSTVTKSLSAKLFVEDLKKYQSDIEKKKILRYFKSDTAAGNEEDIFIGVKMGQVFELAKIYMQMPVQEIEKLLDSDIHEVRAGAVSIMDKISRDKKTTEQHKKEIFDLYMQRHDRINNWDLVDLGCLHMTGNYLFDKPRKILYKLAKSKNIWERRTAILSTCYFIRQGQLDDTYAIADLLIKDKEELVNKAVGWMLRFAGDKDLPRLIKYLDANALAMPRVQLRNSIEKLDAKKRKYYLDLK